MMWIIFPKVIKMIELQITLNFVKDGYDDSPSEKIYLGVLLVYAKIAYLCLVLIASVPRLSLNKLIYCSTL